MKGSGAKSIQPTPKQLDSLSTK